MEWLRIPQVCEKLGLAPDTVRRRIAEGALRAYKGPGRTSPILVRSEDVDRYLREYLMSGAHVLPLPSQAAAIDAVLGEPVTGGTPAVFSPVLLAAARRARGLSRAELAARIGRCPSSIGHYERGARAPSAAALGELAAALGVRVDFFYTAATPTAADDQDMAEIGSG